MNNNSQNSTDNNRVLESRKSDHIDLTSRSQVYADTRNSQWDYEPLFSSHNVTYPIVNFIGHQLALPIWVSSMTGGTGKARHINNNLARAVGEFKLGMGLGSCRSLLNSNEDLADFALRDLVGDQPFYANLGIAQLEEELASSSDRVSELIKKIEATGLIIHINPLQEWLQPEGDRFKRPPIETIQKALEKFDFPIIVKEVGQGMGPKSLEALMRMPLKAIEFAALGGTNFSQLELLRSTKGDQRNFNDFAYVGHTADEMVLHAKQKLAELEDQALCREFIISGGVRSCLQGFELVQKLGGNSVYGQAKAFLDHADGPYEKLQEFVRSQAQGLAMANAFLSLKVN